MRAYPFMHTHAQLAIFPVTYLDLQSFTRVKYGGIRVRLKDISQAIQYKSQSKTKLLREKATKSNKILPANNETPCSDSKRSPHNNSPPTRCDTVNDLAPLLFQDTTRNSSSPESSDNPDPCFSPSTDSRVNPDDSDSKYSSPRQDDSDAHTVDPIAVYPSSYKRDSIRTPENKSGPKIVKSKSVIMSDL